MIEVLRNKNLATRFQILVEIANSGPNIQQQDIAKKLYVTPQAISVYIQQLVAEGLLVSDGRSKYRITSEGVNWVIKVLRELRNYNTFIEQAITNISVCAAVADVDLAKGQTVGLEMKDGTLFATGKVSKGAKGIASTAAKAGEDVGVSHIEGIVELKIGKVTILRIPNIQRGGSRIVDMEQLKKVISDRKPVGAIGLEAMVALRRLNLRYVYAYGVAEAAIEAAKNGLCPVIVCVDDEIPNLTRKLGEENVEYELIDLRKSEQHDST